MAEGQHTPWDQELASNWEPPQIDTSEPSGPEFPVEVDTAVSQEVVKRIAESQVNIPDRVTVHPRLLPQLQRRAASVEDVQAGQHPGALSHPVRGLESQRKIQLFPSAVKVPLFPADTCADHDDDPRGDSCDEDHECDEDECGGHGGPLTNGLRRRSADSDKVSSSRYGRLGR